MMSRFYGQNMKSKNDSVWGHNSRKNSYNYCQGRDQQDRSRG